MRSGYREVRAAVSVISFIWNTENGLNGRIWKRKTGEQKYIVTA